MFIWIILITIFSFFYYLACDRESKNRVKTFATGRLKSTGSVGEKNLNNWQWPLKILRFTSLFGESRKDHFHDGIDISSNSGRVKPISSGKTLFIWDKKTKPFSNYLGLGNWSAISHKNGLISAYMHLGKIKPGKDKIEITSSEILGWSGNTGRSNGAHLHFTIFDPIGKTIYNPLILLPRIVDDVAPLIQNLLIKSPPLAGDAPPAVDAPRNILIRGGEKIMVKRPFSVGILILDRISLSQLHRKMGVYMIKSEINGLKGPSYRFDEISFGKGKQRCGQKVFFEIFLNNKYYLLTKKSLPQGLNSIKIEAKDFYGNISRKTYEFHISHPKNSN